jgi:hypothetical protein
MKNDISLENCIFFYSQSDNTEIPLAVETTAALQDVNADIEEMRRKAQNSKGRKWIKFERLVGRGILVGS